jgi:hypothetical protein
MTPKENNQWFIVINEPYKWIEDIKINNIMTPKEKAKQLVEKYLRTYPIYDNPSVVISYTYNEAKQCALIAVDEIIKVCPYISKNNCTSLEQVRADVIEFSEYWQEVKQEIEKL